MSNKNPDPRGLDLHPLITLWNGGTRTDAVWDRLDALTRRPGELKGAAVLILDGDRIDASETADALRFYARHGITPPGAKSARQLREELEHEETEADPVSGLPLWKGKTPDGRADWSAISNADREVVAYGVEAGELRAPSEQLIWMVSANVPPISRLRTEWAALVARAQKDPEAAVRVTKVRARLIAKPTAQGAPAPPPFSAEAVAPPPERCSADTAGYGCPGVRGSCARPGEVGSCGRVVLREAPAAGAVPVFVACSDRDAAYGAALRTHLHALVRSGLISMTMSSECPGGVVHSTWIESRMREARLVLAVWSADVASDNLGALVQWVAGQGTLVIPILARPCLLPEWLSGKQPLPDKPLSGPGDDVAWVTVVEGVRRAVISLRMAAAGGR